MHHIHLISKENWSFSMASYFLFIFSLNFLLWHYQMCKLYIPQLSSHVNEAEKSEVRESIQQLLRWCWRYNKNLEEQAAQLHMLTGWSHVVEVTAVHSTAPWIYCFFVSLCYWGSLCPSVVSSNTIGIYLFEFQVSISRRMSFLVDHSQILFEWVWCLNKHYEFLDHSAGMVMLLLTILQGSWRFTECICFSRLFVEDGNDIKQCEYFWSLHLDFCFIPFSYLVLFLIVWLNT